MPDLSPVMAIISKAQLSALLGAGYRVLPIEPTTEMIDAGRLQMPIEGDFSFSGGMTRFVPRARQQCVPPEGVYRAMADAAPRHLP